MKRDDTRTEKDKTFSGQSYSGPHLGLVFSIDRVIAYPSWRQLSGLRYHRPLHTGAIVSYLWPFLIVRHRQADIQWDLGLYNQSRVRTASPTSPNSSHILLIMPSEFSPIIDAGLHRQRRYDTAFPRIELELIGVNSPWITVAALCPLPALTTLESSLRSLPPNFSTVACAGSADIDCGFDFDASYSEWSQRFSDEDDTSPIPPPSSGTLSVLSLPTMIRDCSVDSDGGEDEDDAVTPSDDAEPQLDGSSSLYTCDEVASDAISAFGDKLLQSTSPDVNMQDVKEEEEEEDSTQASGDSDAEVGDINTESEESIEEETNLSHKVT